MAQLVFDVGQGHNAHENYIGILPMAQIAFSQAAKRKTVSLTINSDLMAKAKALGLNVSRLTEDALAQAVNEAMRDQILKDVAVEVAAYNKIVEREGSFADLVRAHYAQIDADEAV